VLLSENQVRTGPDGGALNPGAGGWPTIRYFNKETGYDGKEYPKKTDKAMCDELGDEENMEAYVTELGGATLCSVADGAGCDDKETGFIEKWKGKSADDVEKQIERLTKMQEGKMEKDLMKWVKKRLAILKQFKDAKEEL